VGDVRKKEVEVGLVEDGSVLTGHKSSRLVAVSITTDQRIYLKRRDLAAR
jgi:hypothetical protein